MTGRNLRFVVTICSALLLPSPVAWASDPAILDFPHDMLGQENPTVSALLGALSEDADRYLNANEADAENQAATLKSNLLSDEEKLKAEFGGSSREMAQFLRDTMIYWSTVSDTAGFIEHSRRALILEQQFAAHRVFFGLGESSADMLAIDQFLQIAYDDAQNLEADGFTEEAGQLREAAFENVQLAFVSRGSRAGMERRRLLAPEPERSVNAEVLAATRDIEPLAADWGYLKALDAGEDNQSRKDAEAKILRQEDSAGKAFVRFRDAKTDIASVLFPRPVSYRQTAQQLKADEALLLLYAGPGQADIFVATNGALEWRRTTAQWPEISARVASFRQAMGVPIARGAVSMDEPAEPAPTDRISGDAYWLFKELFGPVSESFANRPHLIVASTGIFSTIPLSALLQTEPAQGDDFSKMDWLVRHHSVLLIPAVEMLAQRHDDRVRSNAAYLAFANPRYSGNGSNPGPIYSQLVETLQPLPETMDEVAAVASHFAAEQRVVLAGDEATEKRLQAMSDSGELSRFGIVHFATHGILSDETALSADQGLALTPMLNDESGVYAMAEPYTPQRTYQIIPDGFLTDREVSRLKMDADIVVLSACNTGLGMSNMDDGFSGLSASFLAAGSRAVISSFWSVDSAAAVDLISQSLPEMMNGKTPSVALQSAMLAMIARSGASAEPRRWAPLAVYGEP